MINLVFIQQIKGDNYMDIDPQHMLKHAKLEIQTLRSHVYQKNRFFSILRKNK